jgi:hypothetical protein
VTRETQVSGVHLQGHQQGPGIRSDVELLGGCTAAVEVAWKGERTQWGECFKRTVHRVRCPLPTKHIHKLLSPF